MTTKTVRFRPGILLDNTRDAATGGLVKAQWVRFRRLGGEDTALPESMPGFEIVTPEAVDGIARGAHAWLDQTGQPLLATSTPTNVYAYVGGELRTITPKWGEFWLADPISVENGQSTITVEFNVYDADSNTSVVAPHGLIPGDSITLSHVDTIGGLDLNGTFDIVDVPTLTTFTFTGPGLASSTTTMSGASKVWLSVAWREGLVDGTGGTGFGTGSYGVGSYGLPSVGDYEPRSTSFDNLGDRLYFVPRSGPLFAYNPRDRYEELIVNGDFAAAAGWALGTGWAITGGKLVATAGTGSNASQNIEDRAEAGVVNRVTVTASGISAGSFYIGINAGSPGAVVRLSPDISKDGTWSIPLQVPADPKDLVIAKNATFAGSIDDVKMGVETIAYRINEAPIASDSMFIDQRGIIVLCATYRVDGVFNPNCLRSSGIDNERVWVPDNNNVASEYILTKGGRAVGGRASRNTIAVWTDDAFFTASYTGATGLAYNFVLSGTGCGLIAPLAHAEHAGFVFWLSPAGQFFSVAYDFQGTRPVPVECSGRKTFFDSIAPSQVGKIFAQANTENNEIWFHIASKGEDGENVEVDQAALFSIADGVWSFTALDRTAGVKSGVFQYPILFAPDGQFYYHEKGFTANGLPLESYLICAPIMLGDGDTNWDWDRFVCDFKDQVGNLSFTLYGQDLPRDEAWERPAQIITPTTPVVDDLITARRVWFKLHANASPSSWRLGAIQIDGKARAGRR